MLPAGDATEIGERGINLSGGQKARVSLARACYAQSDIILMDDPLAAVDAHVGAELADGCIQRFLSDRTRLLVTNALHILPVADLVVVMKEGKVVEHGTYAALSESGVELPTLLAAYGHDAGDAVEAEAEEGEAELATLPAPARESRSASVSLDVARKSGGEGRASVDVRKSVERHVVEVRARWVTLRARWVTLRARWVTLRAHWVTLRARWVTLGEEEGGVGQADAGGAACGGLGGAEGLHAVRDAGGRAGVRAHHAGVVRAGAGGQGPLVAVPVAVDVCHV
jgi:hypothetical protein